MSKIPQKLFSKQVFLEMNESGPVGQPQRRYGLIISTMLDATNRDFDLTKCEQCDGAKLLSCCAIFKKLIKKH